MILDGVSMYCIPIVGYKYPISCRTPNLFIGMGALLFSNPRRTRCSSHFYMLNLFYVLSSTISCIYAGSSPGTAMWYTGDVVPSTFHTLEFSIFISNLVLQHITLVLCKRRFFYITFNASRIPDSPAWLTYAK